MPSQSRSAFERAQLDRLLASGLITRQQYDDSVRRLRRRASARRRPTGRAHPRTAPTTEEARAYTEHVRSTWKPRGQTAAARQRHKAKAQTRQEKYRKRQRQMLERWTNVLIGAGQRDAAPRGIPLRAWRAAQLMRDGSMSQCRRATRIFLAQVPQWYRHRILRAAKSPDGYAGGRRVDREHTRDIDSPGARRTLHLGILLWMMAEDTRRRGYSKVVRGFGRGVFASMLRSWGAGRPALSTLFGADPRTELPGAARALELAGAMSYSQPPSDRASASDRGPSGWAYNVYWIRRPPRAEPDQGEAAVRAQYGVPDPWWWRPLESEGTDPPDIAT